VRVYDSRKKHMSVIIASNLHDDDIALAYNTRSNRNGVTTSTADERGNGLQDNCLGCNAACRVWLYWTTILNILCARPTYVHVGEWEDRAFTAFTKRKPMSARFVLSTPECYSENTCCFANENHRPYAPLVRFNSHPANMNAARSQMM